eukprot:9073697-Pyramimonas_sp.AAC.1
MARRPGLPNRPTKRMFQDCTTCVLDPFWLGLSCRHPSALCSESTVSVLRTRLGHEDMSW